MDEKNVRTQNFLTILEYISSNPAGTDLVWSWVRWVRLHGFMLPNEI